MKKKYPLKLKNTEKYFVKSSDLGMGITIR